VRSSCPPILDIPIELLIDILSIVVPSIRPPGLGKLFDKATKLYQSPFARLAEPFDGSWMTFPSGAMI
jgi:hypothetical protein